MKTTITFIFSLFLMLPTFAQDAKEVNTDDFYMDFAIPELTAFTILDIEPSSISKPGTIREFALGLTNYVNETGDLRPGLALEWAPLKSINKNPEDWDNDFEVKNLTISLGTTSDSIDFKLAAALRWAPIDRTNPLNNEEVINKLNKSFISATTARDLVRLGFKEMSVQYLSSLNNYLLNSLNLNDEQVIKIVAELDPSSANLKDIKEKKEESNSLYDRQELINEVCGEVKAAFEAENIEERFNENNFIPFCESFANIYYSYHSGTSFSSLYQTSIMKIKEEYKDKHWNKLALQLTTGGLFFSGEATVNDLKKQFWAFSASMALPLMTQKMADTNNITRFLRDHSQVIFLANIKEQFESLADHNDQTFFGGRLIIGNANKRFSFEIANISESNSTTDFSANGARYSIGTEIKIMENYWLEFAVGGQNFSDQDEVHMLPSFAFRHSFGSENRFFD